MDFTFKQNFYNLNFDDFDQEYFTAIRKDIIAENKLKGIFDLSNRKKEYLEVSQKISDQIKEKYQNLIVCGMGGSSLGAKALCGYKFYDLTYNKSDKRIYFLDNIHHQNLNKFLNSIDFNNTAFLFVSKSGKTMETICQTLLIIEFYKSQLAQNNSQNLYFITESGNQDNPLAKIAHAHNREIIQHDKDIGGRYSCLTPVSLIAAAFYDIKIADYLDGAEVLINNFLDSRSDIIANGVYFLQQCQKRHLNTQVFMPYLGRLYHFNYWYNQLFAESIGKQNKGITPLKAIGSTDQHSILQLFLDGPNDKSFTFLTTNNQNKGSQIIVPDYLQEDVNYLNNNKLGDVIYANQESTIKTIKNKNHILRRFDIETLDEFALGQIMAYFMLETIFYAKIIGVNPFDQPAVEEGKIYAKEKLFNNN